MDKMNNLGITKHRLKIIDNVNGSIMHALKKSDLGFKDFGEIYLSQVKYKTIKGWKRHMRMTMNLVVPVGNVRFVFYNEENKYFEEYLIGEDNYCRLTVNPQIWFSFQGIGKGKNIVINIANIENDPNEVERKDLLDLEYYWG